MQSWVLYKFSILCDVEFGLCLCESVVVFDPLRCELTMWGSMLWFKQRLECWRWLIPSWHVVLKSAMGQILGLDTTGQHVPSCVRYGTTCLLIRNAIGSMSCSVEWGLASYFVKCLTHMVQEQPFVGETLALQAGSFVGEIVAKNENSCSRPL
jgi:hypothetical protein